MSNSVRPIAVVCADTHLADSAWSSSRIVGDSYHSLHQIVNLAISLGVPLIGCGDLIDKKRNASGPISIWLGELDRLQAAGQVLFFIQGQHEEQEKPWLSAHPAAVHLAGATVELGPFKLGGTDFLPREKLNEHLANPIDCDIYLMHQVWSELMGDIALPEGTMSDIVGPKLVFTGDCHRGYTDEDILNRENQIVRVINPGSTCLQAIDEPPDKYVCILHSDGSVVKKQLETRKLIRAKLIESDSDLDDVIVKVIESIEDHEKLAKETGISEVIAKPLVWVHYYVAVKDVQLRLADAVGDRAFMFYRQFADEKTEVSTDEVEDLDEITLSTRLDSYLQADNKAYLYDDCVRLINAQDRESVYTELAAMLQEAIVADQQSNPEEIQEYVD